MQRVFSQHALAILASLSIVVALLLFFSRSTSGVVQTWRAPAGTEHWKERIRVLGAAEAYIEMAVEVKLLPRTEQHRISHAFGAALYEKGGSLRACASTDVENGNFLFGCPHEFVGRAIADNGTPVIPELLQDCKKAVGYASQWCQHSIGHGLVAFLGYDSEGLVKALDFCHAQYTNDQFGCHVGAFMEYNVRTMLGSDAKTRDMVQNDFYDPCDRLAPALKRECIYMQPEWWSALFFSDVKGIREDFKKIGRLCEGISDASLMRVCFAGVGRITYLNVGDASEVQDLCAVASPAYEHVLWCLQGAANRFFLQDGAKGSAAAHTICTVADKTQTERCLKFSEPGRNVLTDSE